MIKIYNRENTDYDIEQVAGEKYLEWTYSSPIGMGLLNLFIKKKLFSKLYGHYCNTPRSKKRIHSFISEFNIDMTLSKKDIFNFQCFNDFFSRELTELARPIPTLSNQLMSPADGRILVYEDIDLDNLIQVKGFSYSLKELLQDYPTASNYVGGTCMIVRLCPTDYHRFHFIDSGTCCPSTKLIGDYYSVNPIALSKIANLYCRNKREWSVFASDNFGDVLYVEVGATCVGSIIQSYAEESSIIRGQEKGYFLFGGSTVILFFEANKVKIDADIVTQSKLGFETKVNMGEKIGEAFI